MENNANGVCPSNIVTGKYWERKNSFNVMGRDKTMKVECKGPGKVGKFFDAYLNVHFQFLRPFNPLTIQKLYGIIFNG